MNTRFHSDLLQPEHIENFRKLGYCVVDDLFEPDEIQQIEEFFEDYKCRGYTTFEGKRIEEVDPRQRQVRAMHPHRHCPQALKWATSARLASVLETLLGAEPLLAQTMYYFKPPGACGQGMHQDDFYLLTRPHHCIAAWTAIDDADRENGCLFMVPGSHNGELICPPETKADPTKNANGGVLSLAESTKKAVPVPVKRGQTAFFGGALIHGSGANRSKTRSRRTFIGHYCDAVTDSISRFYHPVMNLRGEVVSSIGETRGGGPCGDGWGGAEH